MICREVHDGLVLIVTEKTSVTAFAVHASLFIIGGCIELCTFSIQGAG